MKTLTIAFALAVLALGFLPAPGRADDLKIDPDKYGALAYSVSTGKYGYAWNHDTRAEAEKAALEKVKATDAKVLTWVKFGWAVLVIAEDGAYGYDQVHGDGVTDKEAIAKAKAQLRKHTDARIKTTVVVCSGDVEPKIIKK